MSEVETDQARIKEIISSRPDQLPEGREKQKFDLQWVSSLVSECSEKAVTPFLIRRGEYNVMTDREKDCLAAFLVQNPSICMTVRQAVSLRSALLHQKAMDRHHILNRKANELARKYKKAGAPFFRFQGMSTALQ